MSSTTAASMDELVSEFWAANDEEKKKILKEKKEAIKANSKNARILLRATLPLSVRVDQATDEIPVVAGMKRAVIWLGSGAGFVGLVLKGVRLVFG